jgi:HNH endonuclease
VPMPPVCWEGAVARIDFDGPGGCWLWRGYVSKSTGYGGLGIRGLLAHRLIYEELIGPIPKGLQIDHLCRVRRCVNPWHLEPVTRKVNILRGEGRAALNARKTACPKGHAYDLVLASGSRWCSRCAREARLRYAAKEKS